jgi:hypothetical protein
LRAVVLLIAFLLLASCDAPSAPHQFWWNWWAVAAAALATLGAVFVALWAALRKSKPPLLKLKVLRTEGEATQLNSGEHVRNYHLEVRNDERSSVATRVQVYLTLLKELKHGSWEEVWRGNLPLSWRDQQFVPKFQKLGSAKDCDLCVVGEHTGLSLLPLFWPNSLRPHAYQRNGECTWMLSLEARSDQADSAGGIRVKIRWDGIWAHGDSDIQEHLQVKLLPGPTT